MARFGGGGAVGERGAPVSNSVRLSRATSSPVTYDPDVLLVVVVVVAVCVDEPVSPVSGLTGDLGASATV